MGSKIQLQMGYDQTKQLIFYSVNILSVQHIYDQKARQVKTLMIVMLDENNINEYHH